MPKDGHDRDLVNAPVGAGCGPEPDTQNGNGRKGLFGSDHLEVLQFPDHQTNHFTDTKEAEELVASLPLERLDSYEADGETGNLNRYYLMGSGVKS